MADTMKARRNAPLIRTNLMGILLLAAIMMSITATTQIYTEGRHEDKQEWHKSKEERIETHKNTHRHKHTKKAIIAITTIGVTTITTVIPCCCLALPSKQ